MSLVVSSSPRANHDSVFWFSSIFRAIKQAERNGESELFIIGGEQIFKSALSLVDRIYLSEVKTTLSGDAFFPQLSLKNWKEVSQQEFKKNAENDYDFTFKILDRK
jgi:dihydrofolate reductase